MNFSHRVREASASWLPMTRTRSWVEAFKDLVVQSAHAIVAPRHTQQTLGLWLLDDKRGRLIGKVTCIHRYRDARGVGLLYPIGSVRVDHGHTQVFRVWRVTTSQCFGTLVNIYQRITTNPQGFMIIGEPPQKPLRSPARRNKQI